MPPYLFLLAFLVAAAPLYGQLVGDKQNGLASYYSEEYEGAETAYGETYRGGEMVAAHKTFPYNSRVQVRNQANGRTAVVRIIDKGPFIRGRIIELSRRAARELGMIGERTVPVELTLLSTPDQPATVVEPEVLIVQPPPSPGPDPEPEAEPAPAERAPPSTATPTPTPTRDPPPAAARSFSPGLYRIGLDPVEEAAYAVQVGSFSNLQRALDRVAELRGRYFDDVLIERTVAGGAERYRVMLGPFPDRPSASHYSASLKTRYGIGGFPVRINNN
jgi:rare lipoprotein A